MSTKNKWTLKTLYPYHLKWGSSYAYGAYDVTIFEDLGNGQTKLTFIGNEPMESAKNSGQMEGWNQILDKVAAVIAGLVQAR